MRRFLLVVPFILACGTSETPMADSAAMAAAPVMLTDADLAGTWSGTAMIEGTDSVVANWTNVCGNGTCRFTSIESPNDTVTQTYVLDADSTVGSSQPYAEPALGGVMVIDSWVGRISGNQITGTGMAKLADKPDSVVMRYRFTGTRIP
jgi:hypothetical protein